MPLAPLLALLLGIPLTVIGLAEWPVVTLALLATIGWLAAARRRDSQWRRVFWVAALFGTTGESICVLIDWIGPGTGLWIYKFPSPFNLNLPLPIWLPLVWGNLFVLFGALAQRTAPAALPSTRRGRLLHVILLFAIAGYGLAIARSVMLGITIVMTPFLLLFLLRWHSYRDLALFGIAAFLGTLGEILAMKSGLWMYTSPFFKNSFLSGLGIDGVPLSLPMAWGLSTVFVWRLSGEMSTPARSAEP